MNLLEKTKAGYTEGIVSIIVNSILFVLKIWAGIVTGSIALTADAWHTLSDSLSSIVVVVAVKLSSKKPDEEHPFGHGRWEQIAALLISFMLAIIAYEFMKNSIRQLSNKESIIFGKIAIIVTIISIITKEALAQYAFNIARSTGNISIKADGWHHRTDALSSLVILIGIFVARRFWWIDSILGMIVSLMLFYATYEIAKEAITKLLGEKPNPGLIKKIKSLVETVYDGDLQPHHFHIHNYVAHQELIFHIKIDNDISIYKGHEIATKIENKIFDVLGIIATVHVEPLHYAHNFD